MGKGSINYIMPACAWNGFIQASISPCFYSRRGVE